MAPTYCLQGFRRFCRWSIGAVEVVIVIVVVSIGLCKGPNTQNIVGIGALKRAPIHNSIVSEGNGGEQV